VIIDNDANIWNYVISYRNKARISWDWFCFRKAFLQGGCNSLIPLLALPLTEPLQVYLVIEPYQVSKDTNHSIQHVLIQVGTVAADDFLHFLNKFPISWWSWALVLIEGES
jgi:hypothetical protein